jgi:uncharacterized membrane protein YphA (DoxX/SURF4 family)
MLEVSGLLVALGAATPVIAAVAAVAAATTGTAASPRTSWH